MNSHISQFFLVHLELKRQIHTYTPVVPSKTIPIPDLNMGKFYIRFQTATAQKPYGLYRGVPPGVIGST